MADEHHAEWLSLLDISGPFLSPPVLEKVFPQGLDVADADHTAKLRLAYEEWAEEQQKAHPDPAIHDAWIRFVLGETLGLTPEVLLEGDGIPAELAFTSPEYGETIRPVFVVFDPEDEPGTRKPRLLISVWPADTELDQPVADARWTASPIDRMIALCRSEHVGLRLGLVTNGERWALVDAPVGETSAHASWYANLWEPEPLTLRAFRSLLGLRRFFGVAEIDRLDAMLVESANYQTEVTDQLGFQVRRAVEVLVQAIDRADADTGRTLLADTDPARIYEAALTVMMRLVFLFSAEERGLLRLGDPMYDQFYAVSTLHAQLQEAADQVGPEVLERRQDAWSRLLGTFRAIYGGIHHQDLQIIPYGSSLFDPDRFPFLEGRTDDTTWHDTDSLPLPIDNRTVLLLLRSLQMLDLGKGKGARKLSFRALDIEQIGHVYETLLDHSAYRATEPMVSLQGNQGREPEVSVSTLIDRMLQEGDEPLVEYLKAELKKGVNPIRKALERGRTPDPETVARLRRACGGDDILLGKLLPFYDLIRLDPWGDPVVIPEGAVFVTAGEDRRSTGTHYTPRALTEEIVQYALEPVAYRGPAEGQAREEWKLKSPDEILDLKVCDPAMGSGAFLVQACRYLSERLVESWELSGSSSGHSDSSDALPTDPEERLSFARRLVADRCLYGVDVNPLAVEMAKLSLWLITLSEGMPFTFLDHALKCGDSLLGLHTLDQIRYFHPDVDAGRRLHRSLWDPTTTIDRAVAKAQRLREELEAFTVADVYDAHKKSDLSSRAESAVDTVRFLADMVVAASLGTAEDRSGSLDTILTRMAADATEALYPGNQIKADEAQSDVHSRLNSRKPSGKRDRRPFHWPVEFPEVFERSAAGFDAMLMNPPFVGGTRISGFLGADYLAYLMLNIAGRRAGRADLAAYFVLRCATLLADHGVIGTLATNTIAQGDTREVCLDRLSEEGWRIPRAVPSRPWPGGASLEIAQLWIYSGEWTGPAILGSRSVGRITSKLREEGRVAGLPKQLDSNQGIAFLGSYVHGAGFVLDHAEASGLIEKDPRNAAVVRPYLNGDDLNNRPDQSPSRWVIAFDEMGQNEAASFGDCWSIVDSRVRPERVTKDAERYPRMVNEWWKFWRTRQELYDGMRDLERVLAVTRVSNTVAVTFIPSHIVVSDAVVVFLRDCFADFGVLNSGHHWWWAVTYASTLRTDVRYNVTDCFETFPFPALTEDIGLAGNRLNDLRLHAAVNRSIGLTPVYSLVADRACTDDDIVQLREAHIVLDDAVSRAYGWDDLRLAHGFHDTKWGTRFTVGPMARHELLDRLLALNHERHSLEEAGSAMRAGTRHRDSPSQGESLFD